MPSGKKAIWSQAINSQCCQYEEVICVFFSFQFFIRHNLNSTLKCNFTSGQEGREFVESATFNPGRKSDTDENLQPAHPTERYQICALRKANKYPMEISRILWRHKSTIYRELKALLSKLDWVWCFQLSRRLPLWSMTRAWFFTSCLISSSSSFFLSWISFSSSVFSNWSDCSQDPPAHPRGRPSIHRNSDLIEMLELDAPG